MPEGGTDVPASELLPWHEETWAHLLGRLSSGRFPHALLLSGPRGVGKEQLARRLAEALVCDATEVMNRPCGTCPSCRLSRAGTHPDIHWLAPEEQGKAIRIDAVRALIGRSALTTQARGMRVFVISPAEAMNRSAANALLKTLEEPVPSSTLVLVSSSPHRLPATIRSRCQRLTLKPVQMDVAGAWLKKRETSDDAENALALAGGAPLLALRFLEEGRLGQVMSLLEDLKALKLRKANPVAVAADWSKMGAEEVLDGLRRILGDMLRQASGEAPRLLPSNSAEYLQVLMKNINLRKLFDFVDELNRLEVQLVNNLNAGMLSERLVNTWLATTRAEKH